MRATTRHGERCRVVAGALVGALCLMTIVSAPEPAVAEEPPPPGAGARAAIVVDAATGAVLYERNARVPRHPASLTKIATALVAVERSPLDKVVKVTHPILVIPVLIGLEPGDELPLEAVLYGLLLDSGNDAAIAIAESVGDGSPERFVGWMNELAGRIGLRDTHFVNPHGLDDEDHLSSAYDMAMLGRALMRQPALAKIVAQGRHEVEGPPRWVFKTRNPLLGVYDGADGIKTGYDDLAGRCLVATATRDGRRAIAVVMNSPGYDIDSASLLDYAFADARWGPTPATRTSAKTVQPRLAMLRADLLGRRRACSAGIGGAGVPRSFQGRRLMSERERLQKYLARCGVASRRASETLITAGRVSVNGQVTDRLGASIDPDRDRVELDGKAVRPPKTLTHVALNKPIGVVSTASDPRGRRTVLDLVDVPARIFPVGRLDYDSEGLIILTDDGDLALQLTHPRHTVEKEYRALVPGEVTDDAIMGLRSGLDLDGRPTAPARFERLQETADGVWLRVVLREGRNRQIRRMLESVGLDVARLVRVRIGSLRLGDLSPGAWRPLSSTEVAALRGRKA